MQAAQPLKKKKKKVVQHGHLQFRMPTAAPPPADVPKAAPPSPKAPKALTNGGESRKRLSKAEPPPQKMQDEQPHIRKKIKLKKANGTPTASPVASAPPKPAAMAPAHFLPLAAPSRSDPAPLPCASSVPSRLVATPVTTEFSPVPPSRSAASADGKQRSDVPGPEPSLLLLLLDVPNGATVDDLHRHFRDCAPLQAQLLPDWATGRPLGAACLALCSAEAARRATSPAALASFRGATLRVCGAADDSSPPMSADMQRRLQALEQKLASAMDKPALPTHVRHVLRCCREGAATDGTEEACRTLRSGKVKQPGSLVCTTLLRARRVDAGSCWLGIRHGLPLPEGPRERLRKILDELDWSAMPAEGKLRGKMADNSFKLGLSTKAWGKNNGPYELSAFADGMGVWDGASVTRRHAELWKAACELIRSVCPDYHWTSVQFNRNFRGSPHRDDKDASYQVAMAFGEYEGGELRVRGKRGTTDVDTRNRWVRFDGRYEHEVLPYEGTRYSVVYFQLEPPWDVDPTSTVEG